MKGVRAQHTLGCFPAAALIITQLLRGELILKCKELVRRKKP